MKHTPGPWKMYGATLMTENEDKHERLNIAEFSVLPHPPNLSVILAAPDLLEACQKALDALEVHRAKGSLAGKLCASAIDKARMR